MDPADEAAARALRRGLARDRPSPAEFRAQLLALPPEARDAWIDQLWDIDELPEDEPLPRGCVPYLPADVATVLEALDAAAVTDDDVFVDVGSGLGRVVALARLCTGARGIGVEIQPGLVRAAAERAAALGLDRVRFFGGDAAALTDALAEGSVFFLYCPFGGDRLARLLDELHRLAQTRPLRICCVGMPRLRVPWLTPVPSTSVDLTVYRAGDDPTLGPT